MVNEEKAPIEIVHTWQHEIELLMELIYQKRSWRLPIEVRDEESDFGEAMRLSLMDSRGEPLRYPLRLVSETSFLS